MTKRSDEMVREAVETLLARGFAPFVDDRGRHIKVRWYDDGRQRTLVISRSPSDRGARSASRLILRRLLLMGRTT